MRRFETKKGVASVHPEHTVLEGSTGAEIFFLIFELGHFFHKIWGGQSNGFCRPCVSQT